MDAVLKEVPGAISVLNDVSAGEFDPELLKSVSRNSLPYVLMHHNRNPQTMGSLAKYENVIEEMSSWLLKKIDLCFEAGIPRWNILLDPGFGFGKNVEYNWEIVRGFERLKKLGFPFLVGFSNKRFVKHYFGEDLSIGNSALAFGLIQKGADIVRIHDEKIVKAIEFANKIYRGENL